MTDTTQPKDQPVDELAKWAVEQAIKRGVQTVELDTEFVLDAYYRAKKRNTTELQQLMKEGER